MSNRLSDSIGNIPGYFDYAWLYDRIAERCDLLSAPFVEVGVFMGKSLAYAGLRSKGRFRVIGVDIFDGRAMGDGLAANHIAADADMYRLCIAHLASVGALDLVELVRGESARSAALFADASLGAVFIDADHSEAAVRADIRAWLPKIMPGGIFAGHDIAMASVHAAVVSEVLNHPHVVEGSARAEGSCWCAERKR